MSHDTLANSHTSPRVQARSVGRTWRVFGLLVFLLGMFGVRLILRVLESTVPYSLLAYFAPLLGLLSPVLMITGGYLAIRGRQLRARAIALLVRSDPRRPVLYLRSFRSERPLLRTLLLGVFVPSWYFELFYSEEEQLAEAFNDVGPFIAIGKPGEPLPTLGAVRIYARDEIWQQILTDRLRSARMVVIQAGMSEGLWWEIPEAFRCCSPDQLLLYFLRMPRVSYNQFATRLQAACGIALPRVQDGPGRVSGFIAFEQGWKPEILSLDAPTFRVTVSKPLRAQCKYALRAIYGRLGLEWEPPPISSAKIVASCLLLVPILSLLELLRLWF